MTDIKKTKLMVFEIPTQRLSGHVIVGLIKDNGLEHWWLSSVRHDSVMITLTFKSLA